jgi:hypothetical protein
MKTTSDSEQPKQPRIILNEKVVSAQMIAEAKMRIAARQTRNARLAQQERREAIARILAR